MERGREWSQRVVGENVSPEPNTHGWKSLFRAEAQTRPCRQLAEAHFPSPTDTGMCPMTRQFTHHSQKSESYTHVLGLDEYGALHLLKILKVCLLVK